LIKHIHGGKVFEAARDLSVPFTEILDFSANINPLGQPQGLKEHLFQSFEETLHYPEIAADSLIQAISDATGLPPEAILPGAGSTPHIRLLARLFPQKKFVILGPAFAEYEESLIAAGNSPEYVFTLEEDDFHTYPKAVVSLITQNPDAVILANPANPTGRLVPEKALKAILDASEIYNFRLIIDEAFIDFTRGKSLLKEVLERKNLLILRSLTKIYAIPGLRLAYLAGHPDFISEQKALMEPWPINTMALKAGLYCLNQEGYKEKTLIETEEQRAFLCETLKPLGKIIPSDANFILIRVLKGSSNKLLSHLYKKGVLARDASNFKGLGEGYLRFAVRPKSEIEKLRQSLEDYDA
jgi:threonine-phosphate decarboxylase